MIQLMGKVDLKVLNLVISGIPSIHLHEDCKQKRRWVLNLVISGIPSILKNLLLSKP